jgi:hypothetical protein
MNNTAAGLSAPTQMYRGPFDMSSTEQVPGLPGQSLIYIYSQVANAADL